LVSVSYFLDVSIVIIATSSFDFVRIRYLLDVNLTLLLQPPVIASLPDTTSISEDLSTRTLIHTLNVTDVDVADVPICLLNSHTSLFDVSTITSSG